MPSCPCSTTSDADEDRTLHNGSPVASAGWSEEDGVARGQQQPAVVLPRGRHDPLRGLPEGSEGFR